MLKAKPVSLRRKSFGGQTGIGIWWRKRSSPTSVLASEDEEPSSGNRNPSSVEPIGEGSGTRQSATKNKKHKTSAASIVTSAPESPMLGWDDDLCRPIYHHRSATRSTTVDAADLDDDDDDELVRAVSSGSDSGIAEAGETDTSCTDIHDDEDEDGDNPSKSSSSEDVIVANSEFDTKTPSAVAKEEDDESSRACFRRQASEKNMDASFSIPPLTRKRTRTFGNRRRPLSLVLTQEEEEESNPMAGPRRISLDPSEDAAIPSQEEKENLFDASRVNNENSDLPRRKPKKSRRPRRSSEDPSLEKAREYFANLDQTQALTLDATLSPPVSSKVTRTRRKTNLKSPGLHKEYQAYAKMMQADEPNSGISPLSIQDYASSRKLHFQNKGQLVDGFLDD